MLKTLTVKKGPLSEGSQPFHRWNSQMFVQFGSFHFYVTNFLSQFLFLFILQFFVTTFFSQREDDETFRIVLSNLSEKTVFLNDFSFISHIADNHNTSALPYLFEVCRYFFLEFFSKIFKLIIKTILL